MNLHFFSETMLEKKATKNMRLKRHTQCKFNDVFDSQNLSRNVKINKSSLKID